MPNFKKNDGFALGGSPFTMKKGSKEINTDGSFRQEAMGKMGSYGSPLFAIEGRQGRGDGSQVDTTSDLGADVEAGLAQGKAIAGELGLKKMKMESSRRNSGVKMSVMKKCKQLKKKLKKKIQNHAKD